ncbi:MAG: hypothetical protein KC440_00670 [Nitrosarchaeum sp.]|nr:hypothetical protein [Nitrosarchaeum sp.]
MRNFWDFRSRYVRYALKDITVIEIRVHNKIQNKIQVRVRIEANIDNHYRISSNMAVNYFTR